MSEIGTTKQIWLIRHGTNLTDGPDMDFPLSEAGREEARAIGAYLRETQIPGPVVLLSSAERRGYETGELIMAELKPSIAGGGEAFRLPEVASDLNAAYLHFLSLIIRLDNPSRIGGLEEFNSVGSLVVVGHRRNALLEVTSTILDVKGWFAEAAGLASSDDVDIAELTGNIMTEGWLESRIHNDNLMLANTFRRAEARGFKLIRPEWASIVPGEVFCQRLETRTFTGSP